MTLFYSKKLGKRIFSIFYVSKKEQNDKKRSFLSFCVKERSSLTPLTFEKGKEAERRISYLSSSSVYLKKKVNFSSFPPKREKEKR